MIGKQYEKAYTEVLEVLKYFPKKEYEKIPKNLIEFYEDNMDKEYDFTIDPEVDLSEQKISNDAYFVLTNLYSDYFATDEEKVQIEKSLLYNYRKLEHDKLVHDYIDTMIKGKPKKEIKENKEEKALVDTKTKENFFTRFINLINRLFNK